MSLTLLEHQVKRLLMSKLEAMLADHKSASFFGKCELAHMHEMVKLCHQIRSILGT